MDHLLSQEELKIVFYPLYLKYFKQQLKQDSLKNLYQLENSIIHLNMFSPNQTLKEIHDQNLGYLLIPAMIAMAIDNKEYKSDRLQNINQSYQYHRAFINLLKHYTDQEHQLLPGVAYQLLKQTQKKNTQCDQMKLRNLRIKNHQLYRQLSKQMEFQVIIQGYKKNYRQLIIKTIMMVAIETVKLIGLLEKQIEILIMQKKINQNQQQKLKYEEQLKKPIPKLNYYKLQKKPTSTIVQVPILPKENQSKIVSTYNQSSARYQKLQQVFRQNPNQPTVSLDQLDQMEYQNYKNRQQKMKQQKEAMKQDSDSDKQQVDDRKKKQARRWDDYKDDHQKGIGNRGNR